MFNSREILTAVEIGTSKICVLVGEALPDGRVSIIGRGMVPSAGSVVKGEICNMEKAFEQLSVAIDDADRSSGRELANSRQVVVVVTGCGIESRQGLGTVFVKNEQHKVTEKEMEDAYENAKIIRLAPDHEILNTSGAYYLVDDRRVRHPLNLSARKLDAQVHIVCGIAARVENFRSIMREAGFEDSTFNIAFAPLASDFGILSEEERENGVVMIDLGAGTTSYDVEFNSGILASGVLQVGFDHVCNDLSIGLDLHIDACRKMMEDGSLARAMRERREYMEFSSSTGRSRRIPLASFETIIDLRLREIFEIVRKSLAAKGALNNLDAGGVLTGGGALFERTPAVFREVFDLGCRVGQPLDAGGAVTGVENARYSTVWGALKVAAYYNSLCDDDRGVGGVINMFDRMIDQGCRLFRNLKGAIRV